MVFVVTMMMVSGAVCAVMVVVVVVMAVAVAVAVMMMTAAGGGGIVAVGAAAVVTFAPVRGRRHCDPFVILPDANQLEQLAVVAVTKRFRLERRLKWVAAAQHE